MPKLTITEKIEVILFITAVISFVLIVGTVGGYEHDLMTTAEFFKWIIALVPTLLLSSVGIWFLEERF